MRARKAAAPTVTIEGREVRAALPEGAAATLPVSELFDLTRSELPDTRDLILPDGVKGLMPTPQGFVLVHQTPPGPHRLKWIAQESPAEYGEEATYRFVRVSLPYVITLAYFEGTRGSVPHLSQRNECFFTNQPLEREGVETPLGYPALLNCSRFPNEGRHPLSWICTQYLSPKSYAGRKNLNDSVRDGLRALLYHLLETGFNRSSEHHELNSWFSETVSAGVDPRLASVEAWQDATAVDAIFALEVPWLPTGHTLRTTVERIGSVQRTRAIDSAEAVARLIFHQSRRNGRKR